MYPSPPLVNSLVLTMPGIFLSNRRVGYIDFNEEEVRFVPAPALVNLLQELNRAGLSNQRFGYITLIEDDT